MLFKFDKNIKILCSYRNRLTTMLCRSAIHTGVLILIVNIVVRVAIARRRNVGQNQMIDREFEEKHNSAEACCFGKTSQSLGWSRIPPRVDEHLKKLKQSANLSTISNDEITLGVDLNRGASITYLSRKGVDDSVINVHDMGREVQLSFYGGPPDYEPSLGHSGKVLELKKSSSTLYVKTEPLQWSCNDVFCECTFEKWISLDGSAVNVTARLNNARSDHNFYGAFGQELPAVYSIGSLYRLFSYNQTEPFTEGSLTQFTGTGGKPLSGPFLASEHWAALVNNKDWGLGVIHPGSYHFTGSFFGQPGSGGPHDDATGYIAPNHIEILDYNIQYTFNFWLFLGTLQDIRHKAYSLHNAEPQISNACLGAHFNGSRQHWWAVNAEDSGLPVNHWHVIMDKNDPQLYGPTCLWNAEDYPYLVINASYSTYQASKAVSGQIFFNKAGINNVFTEQLSVRFDIMADEHYHLYEVALSLHSFYQGPMFNLRFDPVDSGTSGCFVDIMSISLSKS